MLVKISVGTGLQAPSRRKIRVNRDLYDRASPGRDRLVVETRAGAFGFEWVVRYYPGL